MWKYPNMQIWKCANVQMPINSVDFAPLPIPHPYLYTNLHICTFAYLHISTLIPSHE